MKTHLQQSIETYLSPFQGGGSQGHGRILFCLKGNCNEVSVATLRSSDISDTVSQATLGSPEVCDVVAKANAST